MLTLNQIYQAMEERWPYFRVLGQTFRNSIRHNLSMNPAFVNVERPATEGVGAGKGGYWRVSEDKTTSHRGRAKKPRSGTRTSTRNGNVHYVPPMQSEFMSSPTQPEFYSPHPRAYAPYGQPHPPQTFSQTIPPVPFAGKTQLPLPNGNQHCYAGFATPMPPQSETVADSKPSASKIAQLPTRIQPPRAKKARAAEPASGELVQAEMITPRGVEVGPAPEGHVLSTPASAAALSQPSSSRSSVHSAASGPPSLDVPVPSGPDAVTEQQTPPSPSPVRYPGLTLQRQESFVRGSAPGHDSRNSPGKLPTPPSERSSLHIGGGSVYGLTERFSYGLSSERNHQPSQLPSIAALLGPLSPSSSLSVTPPRPT